MLKKIIIFAFIILLLAFSYYVFTIGPRTLDNIVNWANTSYCENPITYKIGRVDQEFDITEEQFLGSITSASEIWESVYGKSLFIYKPDGRLEISLIYDERQKELKNIEAIENTVTSKSLQLESETKEYENRLAKIKQEMLTLNNDIEYWNKRGGAPEKEYKELIKRQEILNKEITDLNNFASKVNLNVDKVNTDITNLNENVNKFNTLITEKPEMGLYTSGVNKIEIFFYSNEKDLVNVLAHEMGHALGLDHVNDENSIMNPIASPDTELKQSDIDILNELCSKRTRILVIKNDVINRLYNLLYKFSYIVDNL